MITASIVADSRNAITGDRITTFLARYPRFIHSELMTHRAFSRNAASSRAIPIAKIMQEVRETPMMPVEWGSNKAGMQAGAPLEAEATAQAKALWREAAGSAAAYAERLAGLGLHKQVANRVMEPFAPMTVLITATEYENFFALRSHDDAQPEIAALSDLMLQLYVEGSTPREIDGGDWHIPFSEKMPDGLDLASRLKVATARCARTSHVAFDKEFTVESDVSLHDRLAAGGHWSPFEHCAQAAATSGRSGNFTGWIQYRASFSGQDRRVNLTQLLAARRASARLRASNAA
jgi:thymidylate synthase ThyX